MSLEPKILNKINTAYGSKQGQAEWKQMLAKALGPLWSGDLHARGIKDLFDAGKYDETILEARAFLSHITSVEDLAQMNEAELAVFYYLGASYARTGEAEKAISCLHIVLSQNRFVSQLMVGFSQFIDMAYGELKQLTKKNGEEFVNAVDPILFLHARSTNGRSKN